MAISLRSLSQRMRPAMGANTYRGVSWDSRNKKWKAAFCVHGKNTGFGSFDNELECLDAVNKAYEKYFPDCPELQQYPQESTLLEDNLAACSKW